MISMLCTFVDRFKKGTVNDTGLAGVSLQRDISEQGKRASPIVPVCRSFSH